MKKEIAIGDRVMRTDEATFDMFATVRSIDGDMLGVEYDHEPGVTIWWWLDCFELVADRKEAPEVTEI